MTPLSILDIQTEELAATLSADDAAARQAAAAALNGAVAAGETPPGGSAVESVGGSSGVGHEPVWEKKDGRGRGGHRQRRPRKAGAAMGPEGTGRRDLSRKAPRADKAAGGGGGVAGQKLPRSRSRHRQRPRDGRKDSVAPTAVMSFEQHDGNDGQRGGGSGAQPHAEPQIERDQPQRQGRDGNCEAVRSADATGAELE